ncbi:hypothetical protein LTR10_018878 [Elasticomyces elasticus]|uniref:Mitochondrial thiamine pyrophosphate carrier 1 n=1 Tax=Exophiala sideris TaxID=1016849 RepID=A0ABR0IW46_9EURO|nr:hypothetical protein LTR10_018878 [Elasticomyces elasticus]KAK5021677.1 hypothetical protein LTS07_010848 [Exophiala sideris]KAK5049815.1 hypothetical protein LTR69_010872 [Exophiala sideris]KAK5176796.1 hypothetical protein LTR44_010739 [Eurotiomycetes sp. CCFEE 6388]
MSSKPRVDTGWASKDTQIYYAKKYRQILASGPACALAVLAGAKYTFDGWIEAATGTSPLQHVNKPGTYPTIYTIACFSGAGMVSGGVTAVALTPVELVKNATQTSVLMASQGDSPSVKAPGVKNVGRVSSWTSMKRIVERRGPLGLWTGFRLHFARDVIGTGIYFGIYETTKQSLNSYYGSQKANSPGAVAVAGVLCGIGSWLVTYPLDTMKTRAQNNLVGSGAVPSTTSKASASLSSALDTAAKSAARSSKWKGVEMIILRSSIQNMIQMSVFEQAKVVIDDLTFSDGSRTLPEVERHFGRDSRIHKNDKL